MGYLREKYKKEYFLKQDTFGNPTIYGVAGIEEFREGAIRYADKNILDRINFNNKIVLDIGCGRGEAVKYACMNNAVSVMGVDFSEDAICIATNFIASQAVQAELYCEDALLFIQKYFSSVVKGQKDKIDIVLMFDSVEHIPRSELTALLAILREVMSDRGLIAVNTPHFGVDNDVIIEGLKDLAWDGTEAQDSTFGMHCNRYTKKSFKSYMRKLGFFAISHHLFVVNFTPLPILAATKWSREKAFNLGYPILLPQAHEKEIYEGYSWRTHPFMRPIRWLYRRLRHLSVRLYVRKPV